MVLQGLSVGRFVPFGPELVDGELEKVGKKGESGVMVEHQPEQGRARSLRPDQEDRGDDSPLGLVRTDGLPAVRGDH